MTCLEGTGIALLLMVAAPSTVYLCVRLGAAAFFRSKRDHDQLMKDSQNGGF